MKNAFGMEETKISTEQIKQHQKYMRCIFAQKGAKYKRKGKGNVKSKPRPK